MALTKYGFKRESYEDIVARMETKAREVFGDDMNTSSRFFVGMFIRVVALPISLLWQDIEDVYHSNDRSKASDASLDMHAANANTTRRAATQAWGRIDVFLDGTGDVFLPAGTIVLGQDDVQYYTVEDLSIQLPEEHGQVEIIAVEAGSSGNAGAQEINRLLNPVPHIQDIENLEAITNGEDIETDAALRRRLDVLNSGANSVTARAIEARLLEVGGVRSAFVDENISTLPTSYGTPPGAIQAFVVGGEPVDIAYAILDKKAAGIEPFGTESAIVTDANGDDKEIFFSRSSVKEISAFVEVLTNNTFPSDGLHQIQSIVFSAIGGYDSVNGIVYDSPLKMGERVVASKIISQIMSVQGVQDVSLNLVSGSTSHINKNVDVSPWEIAECIEVDARVVDYIV